MRKCISPKSIYTFLFIAVFIVTNTIANKNVIAQSSQVSLFSGKERIQFWLENYTVLKPDHSATTRDVHSIFQSLVKAAGSRPAINPKLLIIAEQPYNFSLPISLPDGGVVISQRILTNLMTQYGSFDAKHLIAFVLGHELAHLYSSDFWHAQFFRLMDLEKDRSSSDGQNIANAIIDESKEIIEKELFADEQGLLYMTLAGFEPKKILATKTFGSIFSEWDKITSTRSTAAKPIVPKQYREKAINTRLAYIAEKSNLYKLGISYFLVSDYLRAAKLFEEYSLIFPSREVFHNLAMSYHFAAINSYTPPELFKDSIPLRFSYMLDPTEKLFLRSHRSGRSNKSEEQAIKNYEKWIKKAIYYYEASLQRDAHYLPTRINLSTAYIGLGDIYKSIGLLQDIQKISNHSGILNNLGLAFELLDDTEKAKDYFEQAVSSHQGVSKEALYNIGRLYHLQGRHRKAKKYWKRYLKHDKKSLFASQLISIADFKRPNTNAFPVREQIDTMDLNHKKTKYLEKWQLQNKHTIKIDSSVLELLEFDNGITAVFENGRARILTANENHLGASANSIKIGDSEQSIIDIHGTPEKTIATPEGKILNYMKNKISFFLRNGKVYAWTIYI